MYQYVTGFVVGVYVGTRYDLSPYVNSTETGIRRFFKEIEKTKKRKEEEEHKTPKGQVMNRESVDKVKVVETYSFRKLFSGFWVREEEEQ